MPKGLKQFQPIEEQKEQEDGSTEETLGDMIDWNAMGTYYTTHDPWQDINIDEIKRVMEDLNKRHSAVLRPLHSIELKFEKNPCIPLVVTDRVQFRYPRSKKKRIRKKWAKNQKNWKTIERDTCIMVGNVLHVHPSRLDAIRKAIISNVFEREINFMMFDMSPFTEPFSMGNDIRYDKQW